MKTTVFPYGSILAVASTLHVLIGQLVAADLVVDNFESGPFILQDNGTDNVATGATVSGLLPTDVIGSARGPSVLLHMGSVGVLATLELDVSGPGDHAAVLQVPPQSTAGAGFLYPGAGPGGLATDLTAAGGSRFRFILAQDPGTGTIDVEVSRGGASVHSAVSLTGAGTYDLPFGDFVGDHSVFTNAETIFALVTITADSNAVSMALTDIRIAADSGVAPIVVTTTADSGPGSLRQAILDANSQPGTDQISFAISEDAVHSIRPLSSLPAITDPVVIDGYTQPGSELNSNDVGTNARLLIELDLSIPAPGFVISADDCLIRGLVLNRCRGTALVISGDRNRIEGCFFGTETSGLAAATNTTGIHIDGITRQNLIGGPNLSARNLVSATAGTALVVGGSGTRVMGNLIGMDANGAPLLGNGTGIAIDGQGCLIGGGGANEGNDIAGNAGTGIIVGGNTNTVQGNRVRENGTGIALSGQGCLIGGGGANEGNDITSNAGTGIIAGGSANTIRGNRVRENAAGIALDGQNYRVGGTGAEEGNEISDNAGTGVILLSGSRNALRGNSITGNGGLGIDLGWNGVTLNDALDLDTGANDLQNFPLLAGAYSGAIPVVTGSFSGAASAAFELDFFVNGAPDPLGYGEGGQYIGSLTVNTESTGEAGFEFHPSTPLNPGQWITSTATDVLGNTSEFSAARAVEDAGISINRGPVDLAVSVGAPGAFELNVAGSPPLTYQWRLNGENIPGATTSTYSIPAVRLEDAGTYTVVVANVTGAVESDAASLSVIDISLLELVDNFADRRVFRDDTFTGATNNLAATFEAPDEPRHADKLGGKSMWLTWKPRVSGVASFSTAGSAFDTLLAVYTGDSLTTLQTVAGDDDQGGYLTSALRFNAVADTEYQVAIDGFAGASGELILSWELVPAAPPLPEITQSPENVVAAENAPVSLVIASPTPGATVQWLFNGLPLTGATAPTLAFTATPDRVGTYRARVTSADGLASLDSANALVEVVPAGFPEPQAGETASADKWQDLFDEDTAPGAPGAPGRVLLKGRPALMGFTSVSLGLGGRYTDLRGLGQGGASTREAADPQECGAISGVSRWFRFRVPVSRSIAFKVEGGEVAVTLGVFQVVGATAKERGLLEGRCAWGGGVHSPAQVVLPTRPGIDYLVVVAAAGNDAGRVLLEWNGSEAMELEQPGIGFKDGRPLLEWLVVPGRYEVRSAENILDWQPRAQLEATSALLRYHDPEPVTQPARYYQLQLLPTQP